MPGHAYLLEIQPWLRAQEKAYFAVSDPTGQRMWSLLIAHPIYAAHGWHLCHLVHSPDAPRGVNELAVMEAIESLGSEGVRFATFGPVAAAGLGEVLGAGRCLRFGIAWAYRALARKGGYGQTAEFYHKVQAHGWQPRYMVFHPRLHFVHTLRAMLELTHVFGFHRTH